MMRLLRRCHGMAQRLSDILYDEEEALERSDASFSFNPFRRYGLWWVSDSPCVVGVGTRLSRFRGKRCHLRGHKHSIGHLSGETAVRDLSPIRADCVRSALPKGLSFLATMCITRYS